MFATDISTEALSVAKRAIYDDTKIANIPEHYRYKYLLRSRDASNQIFKISPKLRPSVKFAHFNLMQSEYPPAQTFDMIFCRNVLIYFSPTDRIKVIAKLTKSLRVGGILVLGLSESMSDYRRYFDVVGPTMYRKRETESS